MTTSGSRKNTNFTSYASSGQAHVSYTPTPTRATTLPASHESALEKKVIVRSSTVDQITIRYDAAREAERRDNLLSNRGQERSASTFSK